MFKKYLLLSSVAAALAGCGGSSEVDLGPKNTSVVTVPEAGEVFTPAWDFSEASQVNDWTIESTKSDPDAPASELYQQVQQQALGVKAFWGEDVAKGDSVTVVGTLSEEIDLRNGTYYISIYYPMQHLGNPWGTDPWGESAHHLGTQYVVYDADGNQGLLDVGTGGNWVNSFDVDTSAWIRKDANARPTSTNPGSDGLPIEAGIWHDLKIRVGEAVVEGDADLSKVVKVGVKLNYALEKPEFLTHEYYEDGTPEQYVFIDSVAVFPFDPNSVVVEGDGSYVIDFSAGNKGSFGAVSNNYELDSENEADVKGSAIFGTYVDWLIISPTWANSGDAFEISSDLPDPLVPTPMAEGSFSFDVLVPADYFDDGKLVVQGFLEDVDGNQANLAMEQINNGKFSTDEWVTLTYSEIAANVFDSTDADFDINVVTRFGFKLYANGRDITNAAGDVLFDNARFIGGVEIDETVVEFDLPIYIDEAFSTGFTKWDGWGGAYDATSGVEVESGTTAIEAAYDGGYGALQLAASDQDLSKQALFNISIYVPEGTADATLLVQLCGSSSGCGDDDGVQLVATTGMWNNFSVPVGSFPAIDVLKEVRIKNYSADSKTVYIDNVGFDRIYTAEFTKPVYGDSLATGFAKWDGWGGTYDFASTAAKNHGVTSIEANYAGGYGAMQLGVSDVDISGYTNFSLSVFMPEGTENTALLLQLCGGGVGCGDDDGVLVDGVAGQWTNLSVAVADFPAITVLQEMRIKNYTDSGKLVYIDDIGFDKLSAPVFDRNVFLDELGAGFNKWDGWGGTYDFTNTEVVHHGYKSMFLDYSGGYGAAQLGVDNVDISSYTTFTFSAYIPAEGTDSTLLIQLCGGGAGCGDDDGGQVTVVAGQWTTFELSIADFPAITVLSELRIKNYSDAGKPIYLDSIGFK